MTGIVFSGNSAIFYGDNFSTPFAQLSSIVNSTLETNIEQFFQSKALNASSINTVQYGDSVFLVVDGLDYFGTHISGPSKTVLISPVVLQGNVNLTGQVQGEYFLNGTVILQVVISLNHSIRGRQVVVLGISSTPFPSFGSPLQFVLDMGCSDGYVLVEQADLWVCSVDPTVPLSAQIALLCFCCLILITWIVFCVLWVKFRSAPQFKSFNPFFWCFAVGTLITLGSQFLAVAQIYGLVFCHAYEVISSTGCSVMLAFIAGNSYRLHRIFNSPTLEVVEISNFKLFSFSVIFTILQNVPLVVWIMQDPIEIMDPNCPPGNAAVFIPISFGMRCFLATVGIMYIGLTRKVSKLQLNDFITQTLVLCFIVMMDVFNTITTRQIQDSTSATKPFLRVVRQTVVLTALLCLWAVSTVPRIISGHLSQAMTKGKQLINSFQLSEGAVLVPLTSHQGSVSPSATPKTSIGDLSSSLDRMKGFLSLPQARQNFVMLNAKMQVKEKMLEKFVHQDLSELDGSILQTTFELLGLLTICGEFVDASKMKTTYISVERTYTTTSGTGGDLDREREATLSQSDTKETIMSYRGRQTSGLPILNEDRWSSV
eukprot:TRINITY_DN52049_c0_g1_i1.p1 TRINITY_DN52049_c0_g1~~TRINITY_DN52049_c0_g1_i1.p1  ORF type:complete len:619 (+),score=103.67 TRINITY_DN52049_c0_g1_i1:65-1858(+)